VRPETPTACPDLSERAYLLPSASRLIAFMDPMLYMLVICSGLACKPFDPPERYTMDLATCRAKAVAYQTPGVDLRCQSG
jgi:hypothetical protein